MTATAVTIRKSRPHQDDLRTHPEHASCSPELLHAIGCEVRRQVLVRRSDDVFAMFTISEESDERPPMVVRMGATGRNRLGGGDEFGGTVDPVVVDLTARDEEAEAAGLLIERLDDPSRGRRVIVLAPHGGAIERHTDQQAERLACKLADAAAVCWRCKGWGGGSGAYARWHITSTDLHVDSFPRLAEVAGRRFTHAVAFHGFDSDRPEDVVIGGAGAPTLKLRLRAQIRRAVGRGFNVEIAAEDDPLGGGDLANLVNRLTTTGKRGIQLEQSVRARAERWPEISDAVASVYRQWLRL